MKFVFNCNTLYYRQRLNVSHSWKINWLTHHKFHFLNYELKSHLIAMWRLYFKSQEETKRKTFLNLFYPRVKSQLSLILIHFFEHIKSIFVFNKLNYLPIKCHFYRVLPSTHTVNKYLLTYRVIQFNDLQTVHLIFMLSCYVLNKINSC